LISSIIAMKASSGDATVSASFRRPPCRRSHGAARSKHIELAEAFDSFAAHAIFSAWGFLSSLRRFLHYGVFVAATFVATPGGRQGLAELRAVFFRATKNPPCGGLLLGRAQL
jgi:hypothetical protein